MLDGANSSTTGKFRENDRGEGYFGEGYGLTGDWGLVGWTIYKHLGSGKRRTITRISKAAYALVVDDLNDGS